MITDKYVIAKSTLHFLKSWNFDIIRYLFIKPKKDLRIFNNYFPMPTDSKRAKEAFGQIFFFIENVTEKYIRLNDPKIIIDCGASYGIFSLSLAKKFNDAKIIAFEPNAISYQYAYELFKRNSMKNVHIINAALAKKNGEADFQIDDNNFESASLIENYTQGNEHSTKITTLKLSDTVKQHKEVDLLKIDIEGAEFEVLDDLAENNSFEHINNIFMEAHCSEDSASPRKLHKLIRQLEEHGFAIKIHYTGSSNHEHRYLIWGTNTLN